jgi:hypothetical protein
LHHVHPERLTPAWHLRSAWYTGKARAKFEAMNPPAAGKPSFALLIKYIFWDTSRVVGCYLGLPLRSRTAFPFSSAYLIEKVAPAVAAFSGSWFAVGYRLRLGH